MEPIRTEADLDRLRRSNRAWAVLSAWARTGLLDVLADGQPRTAVQLPGDARAIDVTATILGHMGILLRHPGANTGAQAAWSLSPSGRQLVASGALHMPTDGQVLDDLGRLDDVLVNGGPARNRKGVSRVTSGGVVESDKAQTRRFMKMLDRRSVITARVAADTLAARGVTGTALDLGGGHGRYAMEFTRKGMKVTLFDRQVCVDIAQENHRDQLQYLAGDFTTDDLGGPYDLIFASNIVHGMSEAELDSLYPRLHAALNPGGTLALKDMFLDDTGVGPEIPASFGLVMLLYTPGGRSYGAVEMSNSLQSAGFGAVDHVVVRDQGFSLLMALRP